MGFIKSLSVAALAGFCSAVSAQGDSSFTTIALTDLSAFADPPKNWNIAGDALADFSKVHDLKAVKGNGIVVDDFSKNNRMHLYTKENLGDVDIELDFMMARGSNSGVYLQGRYEIQLLDSWTRLHTGWSDVGAVYARWNAERGNFEGTPPAMNVARAPGLWQHLKLRFRAPVFNQQGQKIKNARFERVYLNGVLVQQAVSVTGPTASSMFNDEVAKGPLVLQGDHGPVAFRNIRYRPLAPLQEVSLIPNDTTYWENRNPILIQPSAKNYLLRSFLEFGPKTLTHIISVGSPTEINYSYDLKTGALLQIWRGGFLDVTRMWMGRGEPQLARPLGSVIQLNDAPVVAVLATDKEAWPDSVAFDNQQPHGYSLDKQHNPLFSYTLNGINVKDSIACNIDGDGITRTVTVSNPQPNTYCRIAAAKNIERLANDLFAVDGKTYYVRLSGAFNPIVRTTASGAELLVPYNAANPLIYSIVW